MLNKISEFTDYFDAFKIRFGRKNKDLNNAYASDELKNTFDNDIKPKLKLIELNRESLHKKFIKRKRQLNFVILPIAALLTIFALLTGEDGSFMYIIPVSFCVGTGWAYKPALDYVRHYKLKVMPILVKMYGDFTYSLKSNLEVNDIKNLAIAPNFDYLKTEDCVTGKIDDIEFEFTELTLHKRSKNGSNRVFKGCLVLLSMPFNFNSHTLVKHDHGKVLNWLTKDNKATEKVALENVDFENKFEVYSNDQVLARYILTPVMMEQLLSLLYAFVMKVNATQLECEFVGNKAVFFIRHTENLLEPTWIDQSAFEINSLPLIEQELALLISIAKQLNLDLMAARRVSKENNLDSKF